MSGSMRKSLIDQLPVSQYFKTPSLPSPSSYNVKPMFSNQGTFILEEDPYERLFEATKGYYGIMKQTEQKQHCNCKFVRSYNDCDDSYLDNLPTSEISHFFFHHPEVRLLVVHNGNYWTLTPEEMRGNELPFVSDRLEPQGQMMDFLNGFYPMFCSQVSQNDFCHICAKVNYLFLLAEINEFRSLKHHLMERIEGEIKCIEDMFHKGYSQCDESVCYRSGQAQQKMLKLGKCVESLNIKVEQVMKDLSID